MANPPGAAGTEAGSTTESEPDPATESGPSGESGPVDESGPDDESGPVDESKLVDESELVDESGAVDGSGDEEHATAAIPWAGDRRYTAPSAFDGSTQQIHPLADPVTEVLDMPGTPSAPTEPVITHGPPAPPILPLRTAGPRSIPPRAPKRRSWAWVLLLVLVIAALTAVAILGAVWLSKKDTPSVSQEDLVKQTIQNFDIAVQKGDLAALRGITCGATRDNYVNYDDNTWNDAHTRIAAAQQYPVVASIDQVAVNGDHAEANVTTFMAYDPSTRSARSFDLQFRDNQWKICQAPTG